MSPDTLALIWFVILGVLLAGYAILDGFDLGVGMLHPFVGKDDHERRLVLNSIGPLWDGNEVWLVTFGGALFAMFPEAYASIFSGFYTAFMLLLFALIFRAVSIEFRGKMSSPGWRRFWDFGFGAGSGLATFLFGVAVGNAMLGVDLDERGNFTGSLVDQLHPYALAVGVLAVTAFLMHGSIYLYMKTEGDLQARMHRLMWRTFAAFAGMFAVVTALTLVLVPRATESFAAFPWVWVVPLLNVLAVANIPRAISKGRPFYAFFSSASVLAAFVFLLGVTLYPNMVPARDPSLSLTIFNASSSGKTLTIGLLFVVLGMPCVLAYTVLVYRTFAGKVQLDEHSY